MADDERLAKKSLARIDELERVVKALVKGMKEVEDAVDEPCMPQGEYYGLKFDEE